MDVRGENILEIKLFELITFYLMECSKTITSAVTPVNLA